MTKKQREMWMDRGARDARKGKPAMAFYDYKIGKYPEYKRGLYWIGYRCEKEDMRKEGLI